MRSACCVQLYKIRIWQLHASMPPETVGSGIRALISSFFPMKGNIYMEEVVVECNSEESG